VYFCLLVLKEFEIVEGKHNKNKTKTKIQHLHCKVETSGPYIARMDDTIGPAHRPQGEDVPLKKKKWSISISHWPLLGKALALQ